MKRVSTYMGVMAVALAFSVVPGLAQDKDKYKNGADRAANMGGMRQDRVTREVRHELVMLPYYGVFDNLGIPRGRRHRQAVRSGHAPDAQERC